MAKIKNIEKGIRKVECFDVCILTSDGRDVRGDLSGVPQYYTYEKAAKNDMTVESWKAMRSRPTYPGFDVDVIDGNGESVLGNTKLDTVRDSYY
jgi:hypothetical protein